MPIPTDFLLTRTLSVFLIATSTRRFPLYIKNKATTNCFIAALQRSLADSNRRRRFCRPLTKPLIQGTLFSLLRCKVKAFSLIVQAITAIFLAHSHFFHVILPYAYRNTLAMSNLNTRHRPCPFEPNATQSAQAPPQLWRQLSNIAPSAP